MDTTKNHGIKIVVLLIIAAAFSRLIPHYPNFTAIGAIALFSGAYLNRNWMAYTIPVFALFLSDLFLGFHEGMIAVYAATLLVVFIGNYMLHNKVKTVPVALAAVVSSVSFFIITNFAVWMSGFLYPRDLTGLLACYVAAIPFFHSTLLGDLFYSALLFGAYELVLKRFPQFALQK